MSDAPLLKVQNLFFGYTAEPFIRDVSFEIRAGEVLGFLGRNGAGKSTTMALACGVLPAHRGEIFVAGHNLKRAPLAAKAKIGYLAEHPPLFPELTVNEYLDFCARLRLVRSASVSKAVQDVVELCNLGPVRKRLISRLSKGFQQRVGIAQALVHAPDVLVLDEPTAGLDPLEFRNLRELVRKLAASRAVLLSSHILPEITQTCDRVQIMHQGRLVFSGADDGRRHLTIGLHAPPSLGTLAKLPGVEHVEALGDARYRLRASSDICEMLAATASALNWRLFHLSTDTDGLEDAFFGLTTGESGPGEAGLPT